MPTLHAKVVLHSKDGILIQVLTVLIKDLSSKGLVVFVADLNCSSISHVVKYTTLHVAANIRTTK